MDFLTDLFAFMKERKKWWLAPVIIVLLLIGVLIVIGGGSAVAPYGAYGVWNHFPPAHAGG